MSRITNAQGVVKKAGGAVAPGAKLYPRRFVVLGVFMFINLTIQILWICFAPVTGLAAEHYGVSEMRIGLLSMTFMLVYIPCSIPASWVIDRFGIRKGIGLGALLLGVFGLLRGFLAADYRLVLACTVGLALAQPLLLNSFTTVAAKWFPQQVRATVSGLAQIANFVGTAIGLVLTPYLVTAYGLERAQVIYGIIAAVSAAAFLLLARDAPPTPPDETAAAERALVLDGLRSALHNRDLWISMTIFFIGIGVFNGLATWIEDIVRPRGIAPEKAGMLGGLLLIGGILGAFAMTTLSDHYRRRKMFMLLGMAGAIPWLLLFTFGQTFPVLLVACFLLGFFMVGLAPVGYQYGAEITFPTPEGTSNGLLVLAGQLSVVFVFAMEAMKNRLGSFTPPLLLGAGLMAVNCLMIWTLREPGKILSASSGSDGR